jgi:hypothetical protein
MMKDKRSIIFKDDGEKYGRMRVVEIEYAIEARSAYGPLE